MADDFIRYDILTQDALRGVVRKVLSEVAKTGLPGDHHFYVSFDTTAPGVRISTRLLEKYPEEMTIVIQHQFWDLKVGEHSFEVGLSFDNIPERLLIPFSAIKGFLDPSVQFGLQFERAVPAAAPEAVDGAADETDGETDGEDETARGASSATSVPIVPAAEKADADAGADEAADDDDETGDRGAAEVVSLDAFRKK